MRQVIVEVKEEHLLLDANGKPASRVFEPALHMNFAVETELITEALAAARSTFLERHGAKYQVLSCAPMSKEKISFLIRPIGAPRTVTPTGWTHRAPKNRR